MRPKYTAIIAIFTIATIDSASTKYYLSQPNAKPIDNLMKS